MRPNIYLLTGPVRTGKTTALKEWVANKKVGGVLSPDIEGVRHFVAIETGQAMAMEAKIPQSNDLLIGRFRFSKSSFEFAAQVVNRDLEEDMDWMVIDEVGPLELMGTGLCTAVRKLLTQAATSKIILVVREKKLREVQKAFQLSEARVITVDQLEFLS